MVISDQTIHLALGPFNLTETAKGHFKLGPKFAGGTGVTYGNWPNGIHFGAFWPRLQEYSKIQMTK
jgi:hypothetical protein